MHHSIKTLKWFVLAFALGFLLPRSYGPLLSANSLSSTYHGSLEEVIVEYHLDNNTKVDEFLELLLDPDNVQSGYVSYPPPLSEDGDFICETENVSTFCLAVALNANLEEFEKFLINNQNALDFGTAEDGSKVPITIEDAFKEASAQRLTVNQQVQLAEETLDLTLAVYNQVQLVYPVHSEMLKLIENLDAYRGNLAELRTIVERYPSKFNGASTAQCK